MWYSAGGNHDVQISETETWSEIPGLTLKFDLPEPASIRVLYSMSVMPDQNFASDGEIKLGDSQLHSSFRGSFLHVPLMKLCKC